MKTLEFEKGACRLVEASAPTPARGQVLIRLRGTLLDETHLADFRSGSHQAPYLVSGEILQPGDGVIDFRRGQSVVTTTSRPLCQYLLADQNDLLLSGQNRGAACMLLGIALALRAVPEAEHFPESTIIGGAGFVGLALSALLPTTTPWVFGTSEQALMCARDLGASHYKEWDQVLEEHKRQQGPDKGFGATLIETTGRRRERHWSQFLTLKGGSVVNAVPPGPEGEILEVDATRLHYDQITWKCLGPPTQEDIQKAGEALDRIPDSLITEQLPFNRLEHAFAELEAERAVCYLLTDESND